MTKSQRKLWIGLLIMALLTPIGIWLPEKFNAGEAWGEWGLDKLEKLIGYIPEELGRLSSLWNAPLPDYSLGSENASPFIQALSYIMSGLLGILAVGAVVYVISRLIVKNAK